ncbi:hypothetical protein TNCT_365541 [Trichonephila clavata]|uniref:Uncharacterized protein n=1 Tax=Trichonephila clavata TaxID=2740835 RepID=A0A8X6F4P4_TRICU|nr:hypothetical protein TNCT_365541 [Trichonephila clavata]
MAVVMVEYPITSKTCFISSQDMCNETIICVLLLQQPFTEGHAFLTVSSGFRRTVVYRNGYSFSDCKSLCTVLLVEVISRTSARVLTSGVSSTRYCIRLCYRQATPRYSSIVKIGCWPDASRISQSVVQPTSALTSGGRWVSE